MSTLATIGTSVSAFKSTGGASSSSPSFPLSFTDGTSTWRLIATDNYYMAWQHTLTETGFAGTEGIDYYTAFSSDV